LSNGWIIYPTFQLSEEIFIPTFLTLLEDLQIDYDYNISKHRIITGYGRITIHSLQTPSRIVGGNLNFVGIDEFDIESPQKSIGIYNKAVARLRGCDNAQLFIVTTPEGYGATYQIFFDKPSPEKHLVHAKTTDNPYLPDGYVQSLINDYDSLMQNQYLNGVPTNLCGSAAYYQFKRDSHVKPCKDKDILDSQGKKYLPLWLGIDFNIEPMTASLSVMVDDNSYTFSEYHLRVGNTRMLCELVRQDYPDRLILACPDMTGGSRDHVFSHTAAERTDIDILQSYGFEIRGTYNKTQRDRLNIVNNLYEKGRAYIDPSCVNLIKDRERVVITDNQIDGTDKSLTHCSDGNDYMLLQQFQPVNYTQHK
jgi:hypothetical protein